MHNLCEHGEEQKTLDIHEELEWVAVLTVMMVGGSGLRNGLSRFFRLLSLIETQQTGLFVQMLSWDKGSCGNTADSCKNAPIHRIL